jgi:hypothetical protein
MRSAGWPYCRRCGVELAELWVRRAHVDVSECFIVKRPSLWWLVLP